MRSTLLLSMFAIALAGCHGHGVPPGEDMGPEDMSANTDMTTDMGIPNDATNIVTFSMFTQDYAQALCAHYMACGQLDAAQMNACIEKNVRHTGWDQDVEIMKGRLEINELQCLDAIKSSRCDQSDSGAWITRCNDFLYIPHQAAGATCLASEECMSGFCQHAGSDGGMSEQVTGCNGVCATPKATGMPCRLSTDCAANSYCDHFAGTCTALGMLNDSCMNPFGLGTGPSCKFGLLCPTFSSAPKCSVPVMQTAVGGDCDPSQGASTSTPACATGLYCQVQYAASTMACTGDGDCTTVGAFCNTTTGFCQNPTAGKCEMKTALGGDCDPHNESFFSFADNQCADGSLCAQVGAQTKFTCQAFGGANADCSSDVTCKVGFYCNASNKCTPWAGDGQPCDVSNHCAGGLNGVQPVCIADNPDAGTATTCQVMRNVGGSCTPGFEDGLCTPSDLPDSSQCTSAGVCAPKCF